MNATAWTHFLNWQRGGARAGLQVYTRRSNAASPPRLTWLGVSLLLVFLSTTAQAQPEGEVGSPYPSWQWVIAQLVPSPELVVQEGRTAFGMRWQVTPALYSFGIHRSQNPWRLLVVEPIVRHSGSLELHLTPEYIVLGDDYAERLGLRAGLRSYVPAIERGEYLSFSLGTSALRYQGQTSVAYEAGAHVLFGFVGGLLSYSPTPEGGRFISTLQIRVF